MPYFPAIENNLNSYFDVYSFFYYVIAKQRVLMFFKIHVFGEFVANNPKDCLFRRFFN